MKDYDIMIEPKNRWTYKVTVYKDNKFLGHVITNDVEMAVKKLIKDYEK